MSEQEMQRHLEQKQRNQKIADAVKVLIDAVNGQRNVAEVVVNAVVHSHPTLQASFVQDIIRGFIEKYAEIEYTDARNEGAKNFCVNLKKVINSSDDYYIPYI